MHPHLEIDYGHMPHDSAAEAAAREGMARLNQACPGIGTCHVTLAGPADGHHLGQPLYVQIRINVAGTALSVNQAQRAGDTPETTVRLAFDVAHRHVLDRARELHPGGTACAAKPASP